MTRAVTRPKPISATETAQMLLDHGAGLLEVATDEGLGRLCKGFTVGVIAPMWLGCDATN